MEDVLEELVGEIRDEFDDDEVDEIRKTGNNEYTINGRVILDELEDRFGLEFDDREDIDTIGGWMQHKNEDIVAVGSVIQHGEHTWIIDEMDNHQVKQVIFKQYINKKSATETADE